MGRPATGHQPVLSIRMAPEALERAKVAASANQTTLGKWLQEAISEKAARQERNTQ